MQITSNKKIKYTTIILSIVLVLFIIIWIMMITYNPPQEDTSFWVKISGNVNPVSSGSEDTRPTHVRIYYFPNNPNNLCRDTLAIDYPAPINWDEQSNIGTYSISYEVPIGMPITVTTDCNSCNYANIDLSSNKKEYIVDLTYGNNDCKEDIEEFIDSKQTFNRAIRLLSSLSQDVLRQKNTNTSEILQASDDLIEGFENLEELTYSINETEIMMKSYLAIFFGWRASYHYNKHELGTCIHEFQKLIENSEDCYQVPTDRLKQLKDMNDTFTKYPIMNDRDIYEKNLDEIKNNIRRTYDNRETQMDAYWECERAFRDSGEEYKLVETKCETKGTKNVFLSIIGSIGTVIALILAYIWRNVILNISFLKDIFELIKNLLSPKKKINQKMGTGNMGSPQIGEVGGNLYFNQTLPEDMIGLNKYVAKDQNEALKGINDKMVDCLNALNLLANKSVIKKDELKNVDDLVEQFKILEMKAKVYIKSSDLNNKLKEVLGAFRLIKASIHNKYQDKDYTPHETKTEIFKFINLVEEAQEIIKKELGINTDEKVI